MERPRSLLASRRPRPIRFSMRCRSSRRRGLGNNTLNTGDNLQTTGAATGATKLVDVTSNNTFAANAPFATAVTMNGVNALDITASTPGAGPGGAGVGGFRGDITGLLVENNLNSVGFVTLGGTGQGLKTLLTDINISGNGSNQSPVSEIS